MTNIKNNKNLSLLNISQIAICVVIIIVCTWVNIPTLIPFTMQSFAIFLTLLLLGGYKGSIAICVYIILGVIGVPVFANFKSGISALFGLTGGYIIGFIFQGVVYIIIDKISGVLGLGEKLYIKIIGLIIGQCTCYLMGSLWFVNIYNLNNIDNNIGILGAMTMCVLPYIIPDILKMSLAISIYKRIKKYII